MGDIETSLLKLATVVALCGLIPAGAALAAEQRRGASVEVAGTVQQLHGERASLVLADGRSVMVKVEDCAAALVVGQPARFRGHWDQRQRFEAESLLRDTGSVSCDRDEHGWFRHGREQRERLAANAPVTATAAISAAERAGYTQVTSVEWEHGGWQLRALDSQGARVLLAVDGWSAQVSSRPRRH